MDQQEIQAVKMRFGIIGVSAALNRAIDTAVQVAGTDLSVLVQGESGVGKENFPQIIHRYSPRKHNPYIAVNCGAIPEGTIDSELFGHEKGAFTSATSDRKGYFEEANGGTIFLDEVGELPLSTQVRLLRVLEAGEFMRVGSSRVMKTNVRVVAATNVDMQQAIRDGRFREDLYYRLNAIPIHVPPLRERKDDIVLLFRKFAADFAEKYQMPVIKLTTTAQEVLTNYYWRGNIRQLKNVTEQISIIEQEREISDVVLKNYLPSQSVDHLPAVCQGAGSQHDERSFANEREILYQVLFDMKKDITDLKQTIAELTAGRTPTGTTTTTVTDTHYFPMSQNLPATQPTTSTEIMNIVHPTTPVPQSHYTAPESNVQDTEEWVEENLSLSDLEKDAIIKALEKNNGNRSRAARELNISSRTLYRRIKEYGLDQ